MHTVEWDIFKEYFIQFSTCHLSIQLDEERQRLAEQLAEAQEKLREREREEGEEMARLRALLADLERKDRERTSSVEEV